MGVIEKISKNYEVKKLIFPSIKFRAKIVNLEVLPSNDGLKLKEITLKI